MGDLIEAVIFDLDGVLVFTDKYHCRSWQMLADSMGWDFSETLNHRLRGIPRLASLQVILDHNGVQADGVQKKRWTALKNDLYLDMIAKELDGDDIYPGVLDFLEAIDRRSVGMGLCSSSRNAAMVLEKLGIRKYFRVVVTGNDIERAKPDPQIFLHCARKLGVSPGRCLVFEDAESGVQAALAAGMRVIGVGDAGSVPNASQRITGYEGIDIDMLLETGSLIEKQHFAS